MVERDGVGFDASGILPVVFGAIVNTHDSPHQLSSSLKSARTLVTQLITLRLSNEPAENVESFAETVSDLAEHFENTVSSTTDHTLLVDEAFLGFTTYTFKLLVCEVHNKATRQDPTVTDWSDQLCTLKNRYRTLSSAAISGRPKIERNRLPGSLSQNGRA